MSFDDTPIEDAFQELWQEQLDEAFQALTQDPPTRRVSGYNPNQDRKETDDERHKRQASSAR